MQIVRIEVHLHEILLVIFMLHTQSIPTYSYIIICVCSYSSLLGEESTLKAIWLTMVDCNSDDTAFSLCSRDSEPTGYGYCRSYDLAAVRCGK